MYIQLVTDGE